MTRTRCDLIVVLMCAAALPLNARQNQPQAPAKPDSPAIIEQLDRLKKSVGPRWADTVHFWCEAPRANRPDDPAIQPAKLFDNVYAIGNVGTVAYVIQTSAGLMMIDALGANQVESDLLPGFMKLGLDPAQVKTILVGHGHADHFGGSAYFQQKFGSKVYVSAADWTLMETPPRGRGPGAPPPPLDSARGAVSDSRTRPHLPSAMASCGMESQSRSGTSACVPWLCLATHPARWASSSQSSIEASGTWPRSSVGRG